MYDEKTTKKNCKKHFFKKKALYLQAKKRNIEYNNLKFY
jgi:hypothetical protein